MKVEVIMKQKEKEKPEVKIGDIVYWIGTEDNPCLVCYNKLVCLADPVKTWNFDCKNHEDFIKRLQDFIIMGQMKVMNDEIEKIIIYPNK